VTIDVETTNPYGVDPGRQKEIPTAQAAQKRYVLVPQTKYRNRKAVSDRRLIALVYNNRISALERKGRYEESVGLAVDALTPLRGPRRAMAQNMALAHAEVVPVTLVDDADIHAWAAGEDTTWRLLRAMVAG
jgi:pyruvate/2-oxoglutarate dehydrogenase complex dihydrolipoamide acyltransferase (E2) component